MKYNSFEDYLAEKCHKLNPSLDDESVEIYEDWISDLEPDLFISYAEQYKNICVNRAIDKCQAVCNEILNPKSNDKNWDDYSID